MVRAQYISGRKNSWHGGLIIMENCGMHTGSSLCRRKVLLVENIRFHRNQSIRGRVIILTKLRALTLGLYMYS